MDIIEGEEIGTVLNNEEFNKSLKNIDMGVIQRYKELPKKEAFLDKKPEEMKESKAIFEAIEAVLTELKKLEGFEEERIEEIFRDYQDIVERYDVITYNNYLDSKQDDVTDMITRQSMSFDIGKKYQNAMKKLKENAELEIQTDTLIRRVNDLIDLFEVRCVLSQRQTKHEIAPSTQLVQIHQQSGIQMFFSDIINIINRIKIFFGIKQPEIVADSPYKVVREDGTYDKSVDGNVVSKQQAFRINLAQLNVPLIGTANQGLFSIRQIPIKKMDALTGKIEELLNHADKEKINDIISKLKSNVEKTGKNRLYYGTINGQNFICSECFFKKHEHIQRSDRIFRKGNYIFIMNNKCISLHIDEHTEWGNYDNKSMRKLIDELDYDEDFYDSKVKSWGNKSYKCKCMGGSRYMHKVVYSNNDIRILDTNCSVNQSPYIMVDIGEKSFEYNERKSSFFDTINQILPKKIFDYSIDRYHPYHREEDKYWKLDMNQPLSFDSVLEKFGMPQKDGKKAISDYLTKYGIDIRSGLDDNIPVDVLNILNRIRPYFRKKIQTFKKEFPKEVRKNELEK